MTVWPLLQLEVIGVRLSGRCPDSRCRDVAQQVSAYSWIMMEMVEMIVPIVTWS